MKPSRHTDPELCAIIAAKPCVACGRTAGEAHHVITRGAGGPDLLENLVPLCRTDHIRAHKLGTIGLARTEAGFKQWLIDHGWVWDETKWRPPFRRA